MLPSAARSFLQTLTSKREQGESMNENVEAIWTEEIVQIEELEEKIAPSGSFED